jgi:hypothetical protein
MATICFFGKLNHVVNWCGCKFMEQRHGLAVCSVQTVRNANLPCYQRKIAKFLNAEKNNSMDIPGFF